MTGGLFDPLGTDRADPAPRPPVALILVGLAFAALAGLFVVSWFRDDGDRGLPVAVVPIAHVDAPSRPTDPPPAAAPPPAAEPATPTAHASPAVSPDQDVEIQNGVRIIRPHRNAPTGGSQTLAVPPPPR